MDPSLSSASATGDQTVADFTPKPLTLSIQSVANETDERLDEIAARQKDGMLWLQKASESVSQMADEMARTQLMLAMEMAAATVSASSRSFQQKADAHSGEADGLVQELRAKVRTGSQH